MADTDETRPYLPERYRQRIREKNRRRTVVKILTIALILVVVAVLLFSLSQLSWASLPSASSPIPQGGATAPVPAAVSMQPTSAVTAPPVAGYIIEAGVPQQEGGGPRSLAQAETALRRYCPEDLFTIRAVNYSAGTAQPLFGFTLKRTGGGFPEEDLVVFIDTASGMPWTAGEERAVFSKEKVPDVILAEFPATGISTPGIWYDDRRLEGGVWRFTLTSGNMTLVYGRVDATTGELRAFSRNIPSYGRPSDPAITQETARGIAERSVASRNSGLPLALSSSRYDRWGTESVPAAGAYTFFWERRYLDYPVDTDGITVVVDAMSGEITGYNKRWTTAEYAFSQAVVPNIAKHEATYAAMEAARSVYPDSIGSVRILSAELRWNNAQFTGSVPRPGSVPLAWKIVFDDDTLRANTQLAPGIAWVDIQTGNVTGIEYWH